MNAQVTEPVVLQPPVQSTALVSRTPADLVAIAVQQGADMAKLEKLMDLQERWEKNEARKAFTAAMAAFKANPPVVFKDKQVRFVTRDGDTTEYKHATLADVVSAVCVGLAQHGLSHRWDVKQEQGTIAVTCIVTHELGHSESVTMTSVPDQSGKKNAVQQVASTVTYLQRYTLQAVTGIATQDRHEDDDGRSAGQQEDDAATEALRAKYADWAEVLRQAKSVAELAKAWTDMPKEARQVLADLKAVCKSALESAT